MGNTKNFHSLNCSGKEGLNAIVPVSILIPYRFADLKEIAIQTYTALLVSDW